ncbi:hypothetical protein [Lysobacter firmicutimachus]|uniref:Uncharacterized protein n=1 Tax=Lysobacter firmicutimachus TaxID=1792846 RepID=A0ABU8D0P5_9GAMM
MSEEPVFELQRLIGPELVQQSLLLRLLTKAGMFDVDGPRNTMYLPISRELAIKLGVSPYAETPLSSYTDGLMAQLAKIEATDDWQAALAGDGAAAQRVSEQVNGLSDVLKVAITNGDLYLAATADG